MDSDRRGRCAGIALRSVLTLRAMSCRRTAVADWGAWALARRGQKVVVVVVVVIVAVMVFVVLAGNCSSCCC